MPLQVISKPDFKYFLVEKNFEFLILASDGLWDVFTCAEVCILYRIEDCMYACMCIVLFMMYVCTVCNVNNECAGCELCPQATVRTPRPRPGGRRVSAEGHRERH